MAGGIEFPRTNTPTGAGVSDGAPGKFDGDRARARSRGGDTPR